MNKKTAGLIAGTTVLAATVGGVGYANASKEVTLSVDGQNQSVHTFGSTVGDVLAKGGVTLGAHDEVVPSATSTITDGTRVTVNHGRPLTLVLNGSKTLVWTTANSVDAALDQLGVQDDARLSVSRSTPLGREGLSLVASTPKQVQLTVGGKKSTVTSTAATVADLLAEQKVTLGAHDVLKPAAGTAVTDKLAVSVQRVTTRTAKTTEKIAHQTTRTSSASLSKGTSTTTQQGRDGVTTKTWLITLTNGRQSAKKLVSTEVTSKPVTEEVTVGTKVASAPAAASTTPSTTSASAKATSTRTTSTAGASSAAKATSPATTSAAPAGNTANGAMWDRIAQCESGGNWSINTGNGYYGGLQFDSQTWLANGGGAYAPTANLASRAQQITIANKIYAQRGLQPWGCAHAA